MSTATVMTKETLESAIRKSKATTLGAIWRALGHNTKVSGGFGKKVRELVPNFETLAQEATKDVQPVQPKATVAEKTSDVAVDNPYRESSKLLRPLYAEGSKEFFNKKEFVKKMSRALGRTEESVYQSLVALMYSQINKGKTTHVKMEGNKKMIKIVKCG